MPRGHYRRGGLLPETSIISQHGATNSLTELGHKLARDSPHPEAVIAHSTGIKDLGFRQTSGGEEISITIEKK